MRAVVQRVSKASVKVADEIINEIGTGYLIYLGISKDDNIETCNKLINKICNLRIFSDSNDKLNLDINTVGGEILLISQFTLYGDVKNSNRPSFTEAMPSGDSHKLYEYMLDKFNERIKTKGGAFGAHMEVESVNNGPVTILIEY